MKNSLFVINWKIFSKKYREALYQRKPDNSCCDVFLNNNQSYAIHDFYEDEIKNYWR